MTLFLGCTHRRLSGFVPPSALSEAHQSALAHLAQAYDEDEMTAGGGVIAAAAKTKRLKATGSKSNKATSPPCAGGPTTAGEGKIPVRGV